MALVYKDGWQQGGALRVAFPPDPNRRVSLQADFTKSRQGAGLYTVQFQVSRPEDIVVPDVTADIFWKVEGGAVQRTVSVSDGTSISGVAQGVNVQVRDTTTAAPLGTRREYRVDIQVAPGTRPTHIPPTLRGLHNSGGLNLYVTTLPAGTGNDTTFLIPQNCGATSVYVYATTTGAAVNTADLIAFLNAGPGGVRGAYLVLNQSGFVALPAGVDRINVKARAAAAVDYGVGCLFGIDG